MRRTVLWCWVGLLALGCGSTDGSRAQTDASAPDAGGASDAAATMDAGADTGTPDVSATEDVGGGDDPAAVFGSIEGPCADLPLTGLSVNTFSFDGDPFDAADLGPDAAEIYAQPNAGGSSKCSEVFSMVVLDACLDADLYKTENELEYEADGSIADYAADVGIERVGVSVTRAYKGPVILEYDEDDARDLLTDKLEALAEATLNVTADDAWSRSLLHVWTLHPEWADVVADAWSTLPADVTADTAVLVTVETGSDFVVTDSCDD